MNKISLKLRPLVFIWLCTLLFTFAYNFPLLKKIYALSDLNYQLKVSATLVIIVLLSWLISLCTIRFIGKSILIMLIIISSLLTYASYHYGVIFDKTMLINILETNQRESLSYANYQFAIWFILLGILPSLAIYKIKINRPNWLHETGINLLSFFGGLFILVVIFYSQYDGLVSAMRNHHGLQKMVTPFNFIVSTSKYIKETYFSKKIPYQSIGLDAHIKKKSPKPKLVLLVIGETARAQNYQRHGYARDTNIFTQSDNPIYFQHVQSCGTATAVSLPCMFSYLSKNQFSIPKASNQDNLIDVLKHAGIATYWYDNNTGCKGICRNVFTYDMNPRDKDTDANILPLIHQKIQQLSDRDAMIVVHLFGSHGPDYYHRYPKNQAHYQPECKHNTLQNCDPNTLINTYDNTIRFTDFIIEKLIQQLKSQARFDTGLIYISDHGESLGEHGLYLHGTPYALAPKEQTDIPMMMWFSQPFFHDNHINLSCLAKTANENQYSHDNLFHSVLSVMDVETKIYDSSLDIFSQCRDD